MSDAAARIVFDHVTKRYPGRPAPAVDDLSLTVPAGEICVLVGPSGGGKTTAMKMVNRLIDITEGDIRIGDESVRERDVTELRRGIGYVIQQTGLFPHMTVAENVATVPRLLGWPRTGSMPASTSCSISSTCLPSTTASATQRSSRAASGRGSALRAPSQPTLR